MHRDLKLGNIVLEKDFHLKLIDFGTAKVLDPVLLKQIEDIHNCMRLPTNPNADLQRVFSLVGTEAYIAPETLEDRNVSYP